MGRIIKTGRDTGNNRGRMEHKKQNEYSRDRRADVLGKSTDYNI